MNKESALKVLERIEGTLIADLRSLMTIAEERSDSVSLQEKLPGGFNYLLHISALIACETLGYILKKGAQEGRSEVNIRYFILSEYFKEDAYKKENYLNALTSLRTNLAHVFGMTDLALDSVTTDISLCVGGVKKPPLLSEKGLIKLNGVKLVDEVIKGFELVNEKLISQQDPKLIEIINEKT